MSYQVLNTAAISCDLPTCGDGFIEVCGVDVPVPGGGRVGASLRVDIPPSVLANPNHFENLSVTATCVNQGQDIFAYHLTDKTGVSCNLFPCAAARVRLCGVDILVKAGAALGERIDMTMPPPFRPDPFSVVCLGSEGRQAVYQLFDASAVTCAH